MVTELGDDIVRVEIEGVRWGATPGQHAYVYFPTLNPLRPWENHPFSLLSSAILHPPAHGADSKPGSLPPSDHTDGAAVAEKGHATTTTASTTMKTTTEPAVATYSRPPAPAAGTAGITLFIRKSGGVTRLLRATAPSTRGLVALLDGPYPNNPTSAVLRCDRLLLLAGGIGITGVLPWAWAAARSSPNSSNARLCWSVSGRSESAAALVRALEPAVRAAVWDAERDVLVSVGTRLDVDALLREEVRAGWRRIGVVVCGPGGLCDDVRDKVARLGRSEARNGVVFELEVDAYSW